MATTAIEALVKAIGNSEQPTLGLARLALEKSEIGNEGRVVLKQLIENFLMLANETIVTENAGIAYALCLGDGIYRYPSKQMTSDQLNSINKDKKRISEAVQEVRKDKQGRAKKRDLSAAIASTRNTRKRT